MTPLEAARALADAGFTPCEQDGWCFCSFCASKVSEASGDDVEHLTDCPWSVLPQIVAALEAAERLAD